MKPTWATAMAASAQLLVACASAKVAPPTVPHAYPTPLAARARPLAFSVRTLQGSAFSTADGRRRPLAILFVTTFDLASQVAARRLADVSQNMGCDAVAIVVEPRSSTALAQAFGDALRLPYPVAMADDEQLEGRGPFGQVARMPTLWVLDRASRAVYRSAALPSAQEMADAIAVASRE